MIKFLKRLFCDHSELELLRNYDYYNNIAKILYPTNVNIITTQHDYRCKKCGKILLDYNIEGKNANVDL
jgi:hypothetical protein